MKKPPIGIVIVTYNSARTIEECLNSVRALSYSPLSILVIDNASTDNTATMVITKFPDITYIQNNQNQGFAQANNQGIKNLLDNYCEYVMLLNPDTIVEPDLLDRLLPMFHEKKVGIVGPAITYYHSDTLWYAGGFFHPYFCYTRHEKMGRDIKALTKRTRPTDFVTGCCMLIRREVFERVGMVDTHFEYYFEDVDFCLRARTAGWKSCVIEIPLVSHRVSTSTGIEGSNRLSSFKAYYYGRNPFLLIHNHVHGVKKITALMGQFCIRLPFYTFQTLKIKDLRAWWSYLRGLRDGLLTAGIFS